MSIARLLDALRWRLRATWQVWRSGGRFSPAELDRDRVKDRPVGHLDPLPEELDRGPVRLSGWVSFPERPTAEVELFLGGHSLGRARLGVARLDVAAIWARAQSVVSGFELDTDLGEWAGGGGPSELTAIVTSTGGERFELRAEPVPVGNREDEEEKPPPPARTAPAPAGPGPRVLVFTHQLNLGGAQLYLLDLLREMNRAGHGTFTVVSMLDGPVRADLEALGIPVHISAMLPPDNLGSHVGRVEELAAWAEGREFDAVLINTATLFSFPGAEVAELLGLPVVWAIHESFPPSYLWADLSPAIRERVETAMARASYLVFEAEATRRLFVEAAGDPSRCLVLPYGLDLGPIDALAGEFDSAATRAELGVPADAEAIACVGTVEPRKAQAMLAQAFELIADRHPRAHLYFVGGRDDVDSEALGTYIEEAPSGERMRLVPITPDVQSWYGVADLLVCASDVESLPRTVLEAMGWETPVLATDVFGLPELISDGETGWLCRSRDLNALAAALDRALSTPPEQRRRIGRAGRELVEERHRLDRYGRQIGDLLKRASEGDEGPGAGDVAAP